MDRFFRSAMPIFLAVFALYFHCFAVASSITNPSLYEAKDIINRDVAVIGGGSSGIYSAIKLRDSRKSVVVVERQNHLGGHAETYVDPDNGYTVDIGVIVFDPTTTVTDYFSRFNVPIIQFAPSGGSSTQYVDFSSGRPVKVTQPDPQAVAAAFATYKAQLQKYPALDLTFNLTYPVNPELLMPFGDYVAKYNLSAFMGIVFAENQGYVPLLKLSTLYMLKYLVASQVKSIEEGFYTTQHHNIQELYQKARAELGQDALLESSVLAMDRSNPSFVRIAVKTPSGRKLIIAKKLLSTAPPVVSNLKGYDLSQAERNLFSQFVGNGYYTGILNNTGLPVNSSLFTAAPGRPYNIPQLPGPYTFRYNAGIGMVQVYYGSPHVLPSEKVKADILNILDRYKKANNIDAYSNVKPDFVIFSAHTPFNLHVSNDAIKSGFYDRLNKLQGVRNTFYVGAAWGTQSSTVLWDICKQVTVPKILQSLS